MRVVCLDEFHVEQQSPCSYQPYLYLIPSLIEHSHTRARPPSLVVEFISSDNTSGDRFAHIKCQRIGFSVRIFRNFGHQSIFSLFRNRSLWPSSPFLGYDLTHQLSEMRWRRPCPESAPLRFKDRKSWRLDWLFENRHH